MKTSIPPVLIAFALGCFSLVQNTQALLNNTTGNRNTAAGFSALSSNTTGFGNTATGCFALSSNTTSNDNTADGFNALLTNIGYRNTAIGQAALFNNVGDDDNTAVGRGALFNNTAGNSNTAIGENALGSNRTGYNNTALGVFAGFGVTSARGVIAIEALGADVDDSCFIGNIYGVTTQSGTTVPVVVSDGGQLGTIASSERFKKDIVTMDKTSEAILSLRPVTFHYKTDTKDTPQFGLIAEEVAKVNPALVLPDKNGKPYTVRYDQVNAMLLNEFLKEHRKNEEQEATISQLRSTVSQQQKDFQSTVAQLTARLDEQAAQIQKVSAQLAAA